jgi:uncharacterized membrane protein HdeD (DUF308 family)
MTAVALAARVENYLALGTTADVRPSTTCWTKGKPMLVPLAGNWGLLLFRAVFSMAFGLIALFMPGPTLAALILLFGAYALVDGTLALILAIGGTGERGFWSLLAHAILGIAAGVLTFFYPGLTAIALLAVIATWAILTGAMAIATAIALREELTGEWALATSGALSVLFGVLLLIQAPAGLLALVWLIGIYAIASGIALIPLSMRLRQLSHEMAHA